MAYVKTPKILLPKAGIDLTKWAVIACDQFTSEPEYWNTLKQFVDGVPSTYHLILPEVFLQKDAYIQINQVNHNMEKYLTHHLFDEEECMILVERKTPFTSRRLGLVLMIDLDEYVYEEGKVSKIVASEKTVKERIPPRVKIRENAPIESPHVLVLIDDLEDRIIEELYLSKEHYPIVYDFELNMSGGHLKGYKIKDTDSIISKLETNLDEIKMIVGDGNHSLASAKVCWETIKSTLTEEEKILHPQRFALVEVISLYDDGLTFEPIHRVLFHPDADFIPKLTNALDGEESLSIIEKNKTHYVKVPDNPFTTIKLIQDFLDEYLEQHPETKIDFVHGLDSLKTVVKENPGSIGITFPPLKRDELFPYVKLHGVLPRKSFSLGEAREKRYYMECRKIQKGE
ncbi:MAG: DUF1015 domain-containing protein [Firmicutes bacterium]|nr:DUF1015 domain-containing protein [Bacillota bacterium]